MSNDQETFIGEVTFAIARHDMDKIDPGQLLPHSEHEFWEIWRGIAVEAVLPVVNKEIKRLRSELDETSRRLSLWVQRGRADEKTLRGLRTDIAELRAMVQDGPIRYIALYDGAEPTLHVTVDAAKKSIEELCVGNGPWDWFLGEDDSWQQWATDPDNDAPMAQGSGEIFPAQVKVPGQ